MSVVGIGTDIIDINRIELMADHVQARLAKRILTANEMVQYQHKKQSAAFLAKRWAAKEAAAKVVANWGKR